MPNILHDFAWYSLWVITAVVFAVLEDVGKTIWARRGLYVMMVRARRVRREVVGLGPAEIMDRFELASVSEGRLRLFMEVLRLPHGLRRGLVYLHSTRRTASPGR